MSLTFSKTGYSPGGSVRPVRSKTFSDLSMVVGEFVMDSTYTTGGETLAASSIDLQEILFIAFSVEPSAGATGRGWSFDAQYNYNNGTVMAFGASATTALSGMSPELYNGTDLSAFTVRFIAFGRK